MLTLILLVFAFVLFVLGGFLGSAPAPSPWYGRYNLISWGLACWVLSVILSNGHLVGR